ncbi:hypothetical protein ACFLTM_04090 [Candidatus Bipolaricaulota bacterium]
MERLVIQATTEALLSVRNQRFFKSERGYQGRFYCCLQAELEKHGFLQDDDIIEMEYQKGERHDLGQRPDIIFHVPAEISRAPVTENNYAVWALKIGANARKAKEDFDKLDQMFSRLHYPLGIFINIGSEKHHLDAYDGPYAERIHAFAVSLLGGAITVQQAFLKGGSLVEMST